MELSNPVCKIEYAIFVETQNRYIDSLDALSGTLVAVRENCHIMDILEADKRIRFVKTRSLAEAFEKLSTKAVTAVITEKNVGLLYMRRDKLDGITISPPEPALIFPYCIAVKKGDLELLDSINDGLTALEINAAFEKLDRRWFGTIVEPFSWHGTFVMTVKISTAVVAIFILLWVISLRAAIRMKTHQIQQMNLRMIEREKLAVLGKMAGQIAHELRNPLGIIKNSVYLIRKEDPSDSPLFDKRLNMIEEKIRLSSDILESILGYSRVKSEAPSEISVKDCLDEVFKDMEIPEGVKTEMIMDNTAPPIVYMDFHQLYSVLRNLILNSVQSMADTGTLAVNVFFSDNGRNINIRICDTGKGIMESAKNKVFNLFYSTRATGTGLGLPISKSIIEANHGTLALESTSDQGTCFLVTLPSAQSARLPE